LSKVNYILGISAYFHDSAACLLKDGELIAASSEERFTRIKQDQSFPINAIQFCLDEAGIQAEQVTHAVFYEKPFLKFERILETAFANAPLSFKLFKSGLESWLTKKLWISSKMESTFGKETSILFAKHHESHAASSCFTSPFNSAAFLTVDGVGESETITIGYFEENKLTTTKAQEYPNSLGLFYSAITHFCGFKANSGEYKLMGLAPYGKPVYKELLLKHFISVDDEGQLTINEKNISFSRSTKNIERKLQMILGFSARKPESKSMEQSYKDLAASVQSITEDIMENLVRYALKQYPSKNICLSGGVALNCASNGKLLTRFPEINFWIQPAAGDSGGALGAALLIHHHYLNNKKRVEFKNAYLGKSFTNSEIETVLKSHPEIKYHQLGNINKYEVVADALQSKKIVGWFDGRAEWGPRSLGNRSILASPAFADMKDFLNLKIKMREGFRPFAPIILEEDAADYFELNTPSPYMLFTYLAKNKTQIPACVHEDNTARVQTINQAQNKNIYDLLLAFKAKTGLPCLINTSFNKRGEPIVNSPTDAINCFFNTEMDVLVMGDFMLLKNEQTEMPLAFKINQGYELD
jgi:carbamoyltransferase